MKLVLPLPPPANHYKKLRVVRGIPQWFLTSRAKKFFAEVRRIGQGLKPLAEPVTLTVRIYRQRRVGDWDGFTKCLCDALQGIAYFNDSQINEAHVYRRDDKANPRIEVEVLPTGVGVTHEVVRMKHVPLESLPLFSEAGYDKPKLSLVSRATPHYRPPKGK